MTPPQLHDNQFLFSYPLMQRDVRVAVLHGVCTVTDDSEPIIELYVAAGPPPVNKALMPPDGRAGSGPPVPQKDQEGGPERTVIPEPIMLVQIQNWLRREMDYELGVSHQIARSNRVAYHRAAAKTRGAG